MSHPMDRAHRFSPKGYLPTLLLCLFLGVFGAHRFYVGKIGTAFLMLFTFGGLGIWALIDLIFIICSRFRDCRGRLIVMPHDWIKVEVGKRD